MPIYSVKCESCGAQSEQFHSMNEAHQPCEHCKGTCSVDYTRQTFMRERHFSGTERNSVMYGFHPDEVQEARMDFGSTGADISDDGTVSFDKRSVQVAFAKRWNEIKRAGSERRKELLKSNPEG